MKIEKEPVPETFRPLRKQMTDSPKKEDYVT